MREIKFRAWYKENKQMHEVSSINFDGKEVGYIYEYQYPEHNPEADEAFFDFDEVELMQFTGLKDREGREIYEGDILKYGLCVEVVFYEPTWGRFMTELKKSDDESEIGEISSLSPYYANYEVIGNIYENNELLEEQK